LRSSTHETVANAKINTPNFKASDGGIRFNQSDDANVNASKRVETTASPPPRGVGIVWLERSFGRSTKARSRNGAMMALVKKKQHAVIRQKRLATRPQFIMNL
jgi:hypothetical protein